MTFKIEALKSNEDSFGGGIQMYLSFLVDSYINFEISCDINCLHRCWIICWCVVTAESRCFQQEKIFLQEEM